MGGTKGKRKKVKKAAIDRDPGTEKRAAVDQQPDPNKLHPAWRFHTVDLAGQFGWQHVDRDTFGRITERLSNYDRQTWGEIRKQNNHCHPMQLAVLEPEAKRRLIKIKKNDGPPLFQIAMVGKERLWGWLEGNVFNVLWWDPDHLVYKVKKKHT